MVPEIFSAISLLIALAALVINFKNRQTTLKGYLMSRNSIRSSEFDLFFVSATQLQDSVLVKLAVFNPGSIAILIKSMTVYVKQQRRNAILRVVSPYEWVELVDAKWWPSDNDDCVEVKTVDQAYRLLYVKDQRDIKIRIPGFVDRRAYRFYIKTNHGFQYRETRIDDSNSCFPFNFEQYYSE